MATVKRRLIENASIEQTADGYVVTENIRVAGVGGSSVSRQWNALNDGSVPVYGAPHDVVPGVLVRSRSVTSLAADHAIVTVRWETPQGGSTPLEPGDPAIWEISSNVENITGNTDKDGNLITVSYDYPADYSIVELRGETVDQIGLVQFPKATFALRVRQAENRDVVAISADAATYTGMVNSSVFLGKPVRTWLCTGVSASGPVGVSPTEATYEFLFNPDTWDVEVAFTDTFNGNKTPPDVVIGTGTKVVRVIGEADLNGLPI